MKHTITVRDISAKFDETDLFFDERIKVIKEELGYERLSTGERDLVDDLLNRLTKNI